MINILIHLLLMMKREENHSAIILFHPHLINMPETDLVTTGLWVICLLKNLLHASFMIDVPFFCFAASRHLYQIWPFPDQILHTGNALLCYNYHLSCFSWALTFKCGLFSNQLFRINIFQAELKEQYLDGKALPNLDVKT